MTMKLWTRPAAACHVAVTAIMFSAAVFAAPRMDRTKLLIGAYSLNKAAEDEAHVRDIKNCGVDFIVGVDIKNRKVLDLFAKYEIGVVGDGVGKFWWGGNGSEAGKMREKRPKADYEHDLAALESGLDHPAIWMLHLGDEPSALDMPYLGELCDLLAARMPKSPPYLNLYPNYAVASKNSEKEARNQLGTPTYREYIDTYCRTVPLDYISYDFYPYELLPEWRQKFYGKMYDNFNIVADACRRTGRSFWYIPQVNSQKPPAGYTFEPTTVNRLRFQAYTAMAFGAEVITWACWSPGWWTNNVLSVSGEKTAQYDRLREVNGELHRFSPLFMRYRNTATHYVGFAATNGFESLGVPILNKLDTGYFAELHTQEDSPLIVGEMSPRRKDDDSRALFVVASGDPYDCAPTVRNLSFRVPQGRFAEVFDANGAVEMTKKADESYAVRIAENSALMLVCRSVNECEVAKMGDDSVVRITSSNGYADYAKVTFKLPVKPDWKVLVRTGEGLKAQNGWNSVGKGFTVPWYVLLHDGVKTYGLGVKVQPRAMCSWRVGTDKVELLLDLRAAGQPLELGDRTLEACEVVRCESTPGESVYATGRRLCSLMCPKPRLPKEPLIGFNDWYAAYGSNTATNFLDDAAFIVSLCKGCSVKPYAVMDDGWQKFSPPEVERITGKFDSGYGPWDESSHAFGMDMKTFCNRIAALGAKPGLWYRPLCMEGNMCDPSDPDVLERVKADIRRFREWGFKFVKIDYLTYDWCGHFKGFDKAGRLIRDDRRWQDTKHTTAETIVKLYSTIRDAAGDDMVILGCNTVNHLCAGLFEASRVGPDTSGKDWEQTKRNGVGSVAFKGIENGTLFAADPDCAGLVSEGAIPWEKNRQWIDLLSRSGMPFFISWRRSLADGTVRKEISRAFCRAARSNRTVQAVDWFKTSVPHRWLTFDGVYEYTWE